MVELADLGKRIRALEDIEAIKELKSKYWRCVDSKQFEEQANCLTEDGIFELPDAKKRLQGRKAIVQFLMENLGESIVSVHRGHNHEIEITSDTTAKGKWRLNDVIYNIPANTAFSGWGFYEDEYVKEQSEWKIKNTRITHVPWKVSLTVQPR